MKTYALQAEARTDLGKSATKKVRAANRVPAAIYGPEQPVFISLDRQALEKSFQSVDTYIYEIDVDGQIHKAIIRDTEFHPLHDHALHSDFVQVNLDEPVVVELPLKLKGRAAGSLAGGKLTQKLRKLRVKGKVNELPEEIHVDVTHLNLGKSIKTGDLKFDQFEVLMKPDIAVASVEITRALRQAASKAGMQVSAK